MRNPFGNHLVHNPASTLILGFALGIFAGSAPLFAIWNELQKTQAEAASAAQAAAELESRSHSLEEERALEQSQLKRAVQDKQDSVAQMKKLQETLKFHQDIQTFVQTKLLKAAADAELRKQVEAVAPAIPESCKNQPRTEAAQRAALGAAYLALQDPVAAVIQYEQSQQMLVEQLGDDHPLTMANARELAAAYQVAGKPAAAVDLLEHLLANLPDKLTGMPQLAGAYRAASRFEEAANMYREAVAAEQKRSGINSSPVRTLSRSLAEVLHASGRHAEAATIYEQLVSGSAKHSDRAQQLSDRLRLAEAYSATGKHKQAIALYQQLIATSEYKADATNPYRLIALKGLASDYQAVQRYSDAIGCYQELLKTQVAIGGPDAADILESKAYLADAYMAAGNVAQALQLDNEVLAAWIRKVGPNHPQTLTSSRQLGIAYCKAKQFDRARPLLEKSLSDLEQKQPTSWVTFETRAWLGEALGSQGRYPEAETLLLNAYAGLKRCQLSIPVRKRTVVSESQRRLVRLYELWGKQETARRWREDAKLDAPSN